MNRRVLGALAATLLLSALVSACSDIGGTGDLEYVGGEAQVVEIAIDEREDAVDISGETIQGEPLDITDLRGQVVVLNVWWSGCGPCVAEMPMLVQADNEYEKSHPDEVAFVGINTRDNSTDNAAEFERDRGVDYPSLYDPSGDALLDLGRYAPTSFPFTYVLDREGHVASIISGPIPSKSTLTTLVDDTLAESDR